MAKQTTRDKVSRELSLIHSLCLTESYCFHHKSDCSNEGAQKRRENDTPETLSLPDHDVKGNFRDCFSHFLRYRLDIPRHNGGTRIYHDLADTIARKAACGRTRLSFCSSFCTDGWWSFDGKRRIWKNITAARSNGMDGFASHPPLLPSPGPPEKKTDGWAERGTRTRGWDRPGWKEKGSERGTFSIYKYKPSRQFQLLSVACIGCQFRLHTIYSILCEFRPHVRTSARFLRCRPPRVQSSIDFVIVQPEWEDG